LAEKHLIASKEACARLNEEIQRHQRTIDGKISHRNSLHREKLKLNRQVIHVSSEREKGQQLLEQREAET
jgi:hypothetical protein